MNTTTRKEYCGAKMFDNKNTAKYFVECVEAFEVDDKYEERDAFVEEVKNLFDKKITSEDGEYTVFKITKPDLVDIASSSIYNI